MIHNGIIHKYHFFIWRVNYLSYLRRVLKTLPFSTLCIYLSSLRKSIISIIWSNLSRFLVSMQLHHRLELWYLNYTSINYSLERYINIHIVSCHYGSLVELLNFQPIGKDIEPWSPFVSSIIQLEWVVHIQLK